MKLPARTAAVVRTANPPPVPRTAPAVAPSTCKGPAFYMCVCPNGSETCCASPDYGGTGCSDNGSGCSCNPT